MPEVEEINKDFSIGELQVENFEQCNTSIFSKPIFVDGRAWRLIFVNVPKPVDVCRSTHISLHLQMFSLEEEMRLDLPAKSDFTIELVHPNDST